VQASFLVLRFTLAENFLCSLVFEPLCGWSLGRPSRISTIVLRIVGFSTDPLEYSVRGLSALPSDAQTICSAAHTTAKFGLCGVAFATLVATSLRRRGREHYLSPLADFQVPIARCATELLRDCRPARSNSAAIDFSCPGTVVITTGFIGYLVAGAAGVAMAAIAVFLPPCLMVIARALHYRRFAKKLASEDVRSGRDGGSGRSDRESCVDSWQAFVH